MRFITVALSTGAVVLSQQGCKKTTTPIPVVSSKTNVTEPAHVTVLNTIQREDADKKKAEEDKKKAEEEAKRKADEKKAEEKKVEEKNKEDHKKNMVKVVDELHKVAHKGKFANALKALNKQAAPANEALMKELLEKQPAFQGEPKPIEESERMYMYILTNAHRRRHQLEEALVEAKKDMPIKLAVLRQNLNKLLSDTPESTEPKLTPAEKAEKIAALRAEIKASEAKMAPVDPRYTSMPKEARRLFNLEKKMHENKAVLEKNLAKKYDFESAEDLAYETRRILRKQGEMAKLLVEFKKFFSSQTM